MAVTLDFSTATPIEQNKPNGINLDMSTAVPISKPEESTLDKVKDVALAGLTAARNYPGLKQLSAAAGTASRLTSDDLLHPSKIPAKYEDRLAKQQSIISNIEKNAPIASTISDIAAQVPLYAIGGEALEAAAPALKTVEGGSKLLNILKLGTKGAAVNTGIQQAEHPDASRIGTDAALGAAMELGGAGLAKAAGAVKEGARNWGSRLYDAMFSRGGRTIAEDFASEGGKSLGQEAYDRGLFGTLKDMKNAAQEGLEKYGIPRQAMYDAADQAGKSFPYADTYIKQLEGELNKKIGVDSARGEVDKILQMIEDVKKNPESYGANQLQELKQNLGSRLTENKAPGKFIDNELTMKDLQDRAQYRGAKNALEEGFMGQNGENPLRDINQQLGYYERLKDAMKGVEADIQGTAPGIGRAHTTFEADGKGNLTVTTSPSRNILSGSPWSSSLEAQVLKKGGGALSALLKGGATATKVAPSALEDLLRMPGSLLDSNQDESAQLQPQQTTPTLETKPGVTTEGLDPAYLAAIEDVIQKTGINPLLTSGARTPESNSAANGVRNSKHLTGDAGDFSLKNLNPEQVALFVREARKNPLLKALVHNAGSGMHIHTELR